MARYSLVSGPTDAYLSPGNSLYWRAYRRPCGIHHCPRGPPDHIPDDICRAISEQHRELRPRDHQDRRGASLPVSRSGSRLLVLADSLERQAVGAGKERYIRLGRRVAELSVHVEKSISSDSTGQGSGAVDESLQANLAELRK